jgi:hypothetical protein
MCDSPMLPAEHATVTQPETQDRQRYKILDEFEFSAVIRIKSDRVP